MGINFRLSELTEWNKRILEKVNKYSLNCYDQEFDIVSFEDMLCYEAYLGMPSHYPHWSYGKSYEKLKTLYSYNLTGLPYEMVINSDPCIAYLMKDNSLLIQILTMAHVYGHNDFFKNNRMFKDNTRANLVVDMFSNHSKRVRNYIKDPSIGYKEVERVLDAAHAIKCQEILIYIMDNAPLSLWEKDLLMIVAKENKYFVPQVETKIINEGWASWWHYKILQSLKLPSNFQIEFLKLHNQIIAPNTRGINPYYLGFKIWESIFDKYKDNTKEVFRIRETERDASFIRNHLTFELCRELNLYSYNKKEDYYLVSEVSDKSGWKKVRDQLALIVGYGSVPRIRVEKVIKSDRSLVLVHIYDTRELHLNYASETLKHIQILWGARVILRTVLNGIDRYIVCEKGGKISVKIANDDYLEYNV